MKKHPDPLTLEQLREIQGRRIKDADVRALLWEIHRLRYEREMAAGLEGNLRRLQGLCEERLAAPIREVLSVQAPNGLCVTREEGADHTVIGVRMNGADYISIRIDDRADRETIAGQFWAVARRIDPGSAQVPAMPPKRRARRR